MVRLVVFVCLAILQCGGCVREQINGALLIPFAQYETLPEDWGLNAEPVALRSGDVRLHGWFISGGQGVREAVLICGSSKGNKSTSLPLARMLHDAGYSVLLFDYRGFGTSGGAPDAYWIVEDARAALEYLKRRSDVKSDRVALLGISMGALAALGLGPDPAIRAFILEGCPNPRESLRRHAGIVASEVAMFLIPPLVDPYITVLHLNNRPVLFVQGARDSITPLKEMLPVRAMSGSRNTLFVVAGAGHSPGLAVVQRHTYTRLVTQFLKSHLSGTGETLWCRVTWSAKGTRGSIRDVALRVHPFGPATKGSVRLKARALVDVGDDTPSVEAFDLEYAPDRHEYRIQVHGRPIEIGVTDARDTELEDIRMSEQQARYRDVESKLWGIRLSVRDLVDMECALEELSRPDVDGEVRTRVSEAWCRLAGKYRSAKDLAAAERCYRRVFDFLPENPAAFHELGEGVWSFGFPTSIAASARTGLEGLIRKTTPGGELEAALKKLPVNPYVEWNKDRAERLRLRTESDRAWLKVQP